MKKKSLLALLLAALTFLTGCGNVHGAVLAADSSSEIHPPIEIQSAMSEVKWYFSIAFTDCTLKEIRYAGDDAAMREAEVHDCPADQVIVLLSDFFVGPTGGDGSMTPNSTYEDWQWVLTRNGFGKWKVRSFGYA